MCLKLNPVPAIEFGSNTQKGYSDWQGQYYAPKIAAFVLNIYVTTSSPMDKWRNAINAIMLSRGDLTTFVIILSQENC